MKKWTNNSAQMMAAERNQAAAKLSEAWDRLDSAEDAVRDDDHSRIAVVDPPTAAG